MAARRAAAGETLCIRWVSGSGGGVRPPGRGADLLPRPAWPVGCGRLSVSIRTTCLEVCCAMFGVSWVDASVDPRTDFFWFSTM